MGAGCCRFESCHLDQTMIIRTTLSKWVMCSDLSFLLRIYFSAKGQEEKFLPLLYSKFLNIINTSYLIIMGEMMIIPGLIAVLSILFLWLLFLVVPIWLLGIMLCRENAWWNEKDKIQKYIEINSPRASKYLIGQHSGYSTRIRTNIPLFYNQYLINKYPSRLSALGIADYAVTTVIAAWYVVGITAYFFLGWFDNPMLPSGIILLMIHAVFFVILHGWNKSRVKWDEYEVISRKDLKARKRTDKFR